MTDAELIAGLLARSGNDPDGLDHYRRAAARITTLTEQRSELIDAVNLALNYHQPNHVVDALISAAANALTKDTTP